VVLATNTVVITGFATTFSSTVATVSVLDAVDVDCAVAAEEPFVGVVVDTEDVPEVVLPPPPAVLLSVELLGAGLALVGWVCRAVTGTTCITLGLVAEVAP
jgi:hypothetical protein